jgi:1,4-dihydroxy-2-naphthoate octaprenyltransferase
VIAERASLLVVLWEAARPRTLPAAVVPVVVGTAVAAATGAPSATRAGLALTVALGLQVAVNYANDLFDGLAGVDTPDRIGPRRVVAAGLVDPHVMRRALVAALAVAVLAGTVLSLLSAPWLLAVGALSVLAALGYSGGRRPYASRGLGELAVLVFFGPVATVGTAYVQGGDALVALVASLPVGLAAVALLAVNNLRDVGTDAAAGKRTLLVRIGPEHGALLFHALLVSAGSGVVAVAGLAASPWPLLAGAAAPLAIRASMLVGRVAAGRLEPGPGLIAALEATARAQLVGGLGLAAGIVLAGGA